MTAIELVMYKVLEEFVSEHCPSYYDIVTDQSIVCDRGDLDESDCETLVKNGTCKKCWESEVLDI